MQSEHIAYIGLGSNLDSPRQQIKSALIALSGQAGITLLRNAGYYVSKPMGPQDQPDYVNSVAEIKTTLSAESLLSCCQSIEQDQGRERLRHWGERTIDLDILMYANLELNSESLKIPHPGVAVRDFVYLPLLSLDPDICLPNGEGLKTLVEKQINKSDYQCQFDGNIE